MCQAVCAQRLFTWEGGDGGKGGRGGRGDFEGGLGKKRKTIGKNTQVREIPLFCDMKQEAFILMAIRDG